MISSQYAQAFTLSPSERSLLLALMSGETLLQAAVRMEVPPQEIEQVLAHLQERAGVATRQALIARAVAHHWII